jgi:hypothetical protein
MSMAEEWIKSFGSRYHVVGHVGLSKWSLCGINLMQDPVENPPEEKKCKKCLAMLSTKPGAQ